MRLINADEVIKDLHGSLFYTNLIPFIEEQPTAYDMDKVVEQIEEKTKFLKDYKKYETMMMYEIIGMTEDLIDIIRAGGKE